MMRFCLFVVLLQIGVDCSVQNFELSGDIFNEVGFIPHRGNGFFKNYLTMNISFAPMADLFRQLLIDQRKPLTNRGEAHITVVTPPEYQFVLGKLVTIDEIDEIASKNRIQNSTFHVICVGRGEKVIESKLEQTYFVVVDSDDLLSIRKQVEKLYLERGGDKGKFSADHFFPHITLGYTKRDLYEQDGIKKDKRSCWKNINIV